MDDKQVFDVTSPGNILKLIRQRGQRGITLRMLVAAVVEELGIGRSEARTLLRESLRELVRDGRVVEGRGQRFVVAGASELIPGVLRRQPAGFALVREADARAKAIRIDAHHLRGALDGDRVLVQLETARRRARAEGVREGVVVRVVERRLEEVVGRWMADRGRPCLKPLDRRLRFVLVPTASRLAEEPRHGDYVVASVESVSARGLRARGVLLERLGRLGDPGIEELVVLRTHGIPVEFPEAVIEEAERLPEGIGDEVLSGRWDLRDRPAITIDPEDARDFDDAVNASPGKGGDIEVEVHIADVSHFVRAGSELDAAARERGTSVYLPGRCVPMLPERVSSDLCTLAEGEDRLSFTVRFAVARDGSIRRAEASPSVIRSRRRCTYAEVFGWLSSPRQRWPAECAEFADSLELLAEAAERLGRERHRKGSLDFELAEPEILLDPEGRVTAVRPSARNRAHRLIEELMVAANRCVARMLLEADQPALHRVHDRPDPDRVKALRETLAELGLRMEGTDEELPPIELQRVLAAVAGRPEERLVSMLVLRAMARAVYSSDARATTRWRPTPTCTSPRRSGATRTWSCTACCGGCAQTAGRWPGPSGSGSSSSWPGSARAARPPSGGPRRRSGWRCCGRRSTTWRDGWGRASTARSPGSPRPGCSSRSTSSWSTAWSTSRSSSTTSTTSRRSGTGWSASAAGGCGGSATGSGCSWPEPMPGSCGSSWCRSARPGTAEREAGAARASRGAGQATGQAGTATIRSTRRAPHGAGQDRRSTSSGRSSAAELSPIHPYHLSLPP